jgi:hypothetical protein
MAADREVLREFLVSLGFQVDEPSFRKFGEALNVGTFGVKSFATGVAGIAAGLETLVDTFAYTMRGMYYQSKLAGASITNLQAIQFAAKQIGISAETAGAAVQSFSRAMRLQPGLQDMLSGLGVKITGDRAKDFVNTIKALGELDFPIAAQIGQMFGIDPDTLYLMTTNQGKLNEELQKYIDIQKQAGVGLDDWGKAAADYATTTDEFIEKVKALGKALAIELLPYFKDMKQWASEALDAFTKWVTSDDVKQGLTDIGKLLHDAWDGLKQINQEVKNLTGMTIVEAAKTGAKVAGKSVLKAGEAIYYGTHGRFKEAGESVKDIGRMLLGRPPEVVEPTTPEERRAMRGQEVVEPTTPEERRAMREAAKPGTLFERLEQQYGLPRGWLDKIWQRESRRGDPRFMLSRKGALGHFGFMPGTASAYGVDPYDLASSATGAAHYLHDLLEHYHGDAVKAIAAYNWGPGKIDAYGVGRAPSETRDYVSGVLGAGVMMNQTTHITVHGSDPSSTATAVASEQSRVNGDLVRNLRGAVR